MMALFDPVESCRRNGSVKLPLEREKATSGPNPGPLVALGRPGVGLSMGPEMAGSPRTRPQETSAASRTGENSETILLEGLTRARKLPAGSRRKLVWR